VYEARQIGLDRSVALKNPRAPGTRVNSQSSGVVPVHLITNSVTGLPVLVTSTDAPGP